MLRALNIAILVLSLASCPLRCLAGGVSDVSQPNRCACCPHDSTPSEDLPTPGEQDPRDCACDCVCNGAAFIEKQVTPDADLASVTLDATPVGDSTVDIGPRVSPLIDPAPPLRPAGRSLRFLIASLLI